MVSISLCSEMETEACYEEHKDPAVEPAEPEVREAISELADRDSHTEQPCGPSEGDEGLSGKEQAETESCAGESKSTEIKSPSDPGGESGDTECKEQKKLRKTNSWKMVRFQDPSTEDDVLERDSSAESLFPEYVMAEWTSMTFEELFMADDWQDITGEDTLVTCSSHVETNLVLEMKIPELSVTNAFHLLESDINSTKIKRGVFVNVNVSDQKFAD